MLSIGKLRGGGAAACYYERHLASGREDYYAEAGEAPGLWVGCGAAATGRCGDLKDGELSFLLNGGELRPSPSEKAVAGFDLTFRAPKSVSVAWGIADEVASRAIEEAYDAANPRRQRRDPASPRTAGPRASTCAAQGADARWTVPDGSERRSPTGAPLVTTQIFADLNCSRR